MVAGEPEALFDHRHWRSLCADDALGDSDVIISTFDNPHTLGMGLIHHRGEMRGVENGVVLCEPLEHFEQVPLAGEVEMHPRLFEQEDTVLEIAVRRVGELPRKRNVPPKAGRSPLQPHGHSDACILCEDVQRRPVYLDIKLDVLLAP